jgi:hypothetical protein
MKTRFTNQILIIIILANIFLNIRESLSQEIALFGKSGFNVNLGCGVVGPIISIGEAGEGELSNYTEGYLELHLFDWDNHEDMLAKPTSGGMNIGINFFPRYITKNRAKPFVGINWGTYMERSGSNTGENYEGEKSIIDIHGGIRVFISNHFTGQLWFGIPIKKDDSESIVTKYYPNIEDDSKIIPASLSLSFNF